MSAFPRLSTTKIGRNKDAPRVWLEGLYLIKAGFLPACRIEVQFSKQRVEINLAPTGPRVVSSKARNNQDVPVLDLNSSALTESFGPVAALQVRIEPGRIILTPTHTEQLRATRCRNGAVVSPEEAY
jgi:DNA (cytosine-5)-methyltransferase 1